ncbi:MAG: hypothetical protein QNI99_09105 [Woeseiaceae bacterium]|nr:hypothetical protein [Woeseiaceae bacterium]
MLRLPRGPGGWTDSSDRFNSQLESIARTVGFRARESDAQFSACMDDLDDGWWFY